MPTPVEEIKSRLDLVDLIQEYVKLTPAGGNFKARCPFHNEKTPSFMVSPEKQIWHCFGCGAGGDVFEFIKKIEGVEFPEALRILAGRANVKLEYTNPEWHNQRTRLLDLNKVLTEHWQQILKEDPLAQLVREYLEKRGVSRETQKVFQLGFAKDSYDEAIKYLQGKNFSLREITLAGIAISSSLAGFGERQKYYDRFRNRLIFPIRDLHGNIVGFTGRIMVESDKLAKYVNTPQTDVYNKSQILYNLDLAKLEIKKKDYAILVEGNMDVLAAWQAGTRNLVAVSGTALTTEQIILLKRFTQNVMIAFDADLAGLAANLRGIDLAWQAGFNVKVVDLQGAKDPDELIKKDPVLWTEALRGAQNFMDYLFKTTLAGLDLERVDHKKKAAKKLLTFLAKLGDEVEQAHYLRQLAKILDVNEDHLKQSLTKQPKAKTGQLPAAETEGQAINQDQVIAERLLALLFNYPQALTEVIIRLEPAAINYPLAAKLYKELIVYYNKVDNFQIKQFIESLEQDLKFYINQLSLLAGEDFQDQTQELQYEIIQLVNRLQKNYLKHQLTKLEKDLHQAEQEKNDQLVNQLSQKASLIIDQLQNLLSSGD